VSVSLAGLLTGLGFTLIPPAISQGKTLVQQAPGFIHNARSSHLFGRLDARFHLAEHIEKLEKGLPAMLEGAATPILAAVGGVLSLAAAAVTVLLFTVFMLIFGGRLIRAALEEARPESRNLYGDVHEAPGQADLSRAQDVHIATSEVLVRIGKAAGPIAAAEAGGGKGEPGELADGLHRNLDRVDGVVEVHAPYRLRRGQIDEDAHTAEQVALQ
jgi:hypothetical protein